MKFIKDYCADIRGNTATMMALSIIPLALGAGAAVDFSTYNDAKSVVQAATDAAALAGAKSTSLSSAALQTLVDEYVAANSISGSVDSIVSITPTRDAVTGKFTLSVDAKMKTNFMFLAGVSEMDVKGYAEVETGASTLELVLVLDNTGSMNANGRLPALQAAAKKLIRTIMATRASGADVSIGVVPFAEYVNVGMGNRSETWINVPADTTTPYSYCSNTYPSATSSNCRVEPYTNVVDGVTINGTHTVCDWDYGTPVEQCYSGETTVAWQGCVGSRDSGNDVQIGSIGHRYDGVMNVNCPQPIQTLSTSQTTLESKIDSMVGNGNTYIAPGLLWGWNMLDDGKPLEGAKSKGWMTANKGTKAIVLMTDGDNTKSPTYPMHEGTDVAMADAKTAELCDQIKGDDIVVYTVALEVVNPTSLNMLRTCATSPANAFNANDPTLLSAAFDAIGESLTSLRLVK